MDNSLGGMSISNRGGTIMTRNDTYAGRRGTHAQGHMKFGKKKADDLVNDYRT